MVAAAETTAETDFESEFRLTEFQKNDAAASEAKSRAEADDASTDDDADADAAYNDAGRPMIVTMI